MNRYPVTAVLDQNRAQSGTVMIDRASGLFSVRPHRRRRVYTLPLALVASIVVSRVVKAEVAETRRARSSKREK